ncbi:hypothetical protein QTP88_022574 [Uroleucon formosanum]
MNVTAAIVLLFVFQLFHNAQFLIFKRKDDDISNDIDETSQEEIKQRHFVNGSELDFIYWNSFLGNDKPIEIEFGKESSVLDYWIDDYPLKVITHGWLASDDNYTGVFTIKTAYVDTGGYNVISVDWSHIAENIIYHKPALLTAPVGNVIAEFLDRLVSYTGTQASDIHLIGHSLGAHVMGSCGSNFKTGIIGRITGLDPARPGFEFIPFQKERLSKDDAEFVDVIHTAGGTLGIMDSLGHADFYPNDGVAPQPGYEVLFRMIGSVLGSHSRAHELYTDSVYYRKSLVATQCDSWSAFKSDKCVNNSKTLMGHDAITRPTPNLIIVKESKGKDEHLREILILIRIDDLSHLSAKIKSHEKTQIHINAQLSLKLLGKQDIRQQLNSAFRLNIQKYNEQVKENRYILSKIIDCIRFCGAFELALRGHGETADSVNPGVFKGLINFTAELDYALKTHLEKATVFKGISKEIQNDILDCTLTICQIQIKTEINQADFLSIIADETTDVSNSFQMSIVFRYLLTDGSSVERFWGFFNPTGHDAKCLSECIKSTLQEVLTDKNKLITQSYDGANVMSGHISGVQTFIKSEYPNAHYVHCYAHQLNLIMKAASCKSKETRIFFSNLTDITNFFTRSPQRFQVLD